MLSVFVWTISEAIGLIALILWLLFCGYVVLYIKVIEPRWARFKAWRKRRKGGA